MLIFVKNILIGLSFRLVIQRIGMLNGRNIFICLITVTVIMFTSCEKDPEIKSTVPYQVVTQDGHCLNALNGRHQGLVLRSRSQY